MPGEQRLGAKIGTVTRRGRPTGCLRSTEWLPTLARDCNGRRDRGPHEATTRQGREHEVQQSLTKTALATIAPWLRTRRSQVRVLQGAPALFRTRISVAPGSRSQIPSLQDPDRPARASADFTAMNESEARSVLKNELAEYRALAYPDLVSQIDQPKRPFERCRSVKTLGADGGLRAVFASV
jgi:hypothetical protein